VSDYRATLRKLAVRDDAFVDAILEDADACESADLDAKTCALVRLASLIALDATLPMYLRAVDEAHDAGGSDEEIVATLVALVAPVGVARVVAAAPKVSLAIGYDVDAKLEGLDTDVRG
jgi:alkylhydroperoxidase/carboxymuconolactone decarboxylase family protein YurZ